MDAPLIAETLQHVGLVHGLASELYHAGPGLSHTQLVDFARSPARYYALYRDDRRPGREVTPSMRAGTIAHALILEPGEFPFRYVIGPCEDRRAKEWKEFAAKHADRDVLTPAEMQRAQAQAAAVRAHPEVAKLLKTGEAEVSAYWRHPETGLLCRCRPDWVHPVGDGGVILVDIKTCPDASPLAFARSIATFRYHWQCHFYSQGYALAADKPVVGFVFVCVEQSYPYSVSAVMLDEESMMLARDEVNAAVTRFASCQRACDWPGYSETVEAVSLPRWYTPYGEVRV